ncbi:MAG: hypothetical protein LBF08_06035 [Dysgonamonadaceae bacterium]|jgi:hypothetical protein|nr:hypothetical protein [Dysgonamonadaceae bacterium]
MDEIRGIEYLPDEFGRKKFVKIDLDLYGEDTLLEDFLDTLEVEAAQGESYITLSEFVKHVEDRIKQCTK